MFSGEGCRQDHSVELSAKRKGLLQFLVVWSISLKTIALGKTNSAKYVRISRHEFPSVVSLAEPLLDRIN